MYLAFFTVEIQACIPSSSYRFTEMIILIITDRTFLPHRFPKAETRPELRAAWINAIRRKNWKPSLNSFLCGDHFEKKCFVVRPGKIGRRLNESAIPSVFDFPSELPLNQAPSRKQLADDYLSYEFPVELAASLDYVPEPSAESAIPEQEVVEIPDPAKVTERLKSEHSYIRKGEPISAETVEKTAKLRLKIKMLNQRVRRKQRRINKMSVHLKCIDQWKQGELALKSNSGKMPKHMIILNQNQLERWEVNCVEKCNDDND